jgi:hypothetical protein
MKIHIALNSSLQFISQLHPSNPPHTEDFNIIMLYAEKELMRQELYLLVNDIDPLGLPATLWKTPFLSREATALNLKPFLMFLSRFWTRHKPFYQLHYTTTYNEPLTKACLMLATEIAKLKVITKDSFVPEEVPSDSKDEPPKTILISKHGPAHRYEILIPTIIGRNDISSADLIMDDEDAETEEEKLQLHHFILDTTSRPAIPQNGDTSIINVGTCLNYLADSQGDLLHTSVLFIKKTFLLPNPYVHRVIYHSTQALKLHDKVSELRLDQCNPSSAGGAITNLIKALRTGGERGKHGGTDKQASYFAHEGIRSFNIFLGYLNHKQHTLLMGMSAKVGHEQTFKYMWYKLLMGVAGIYEDIFFSEGQLAEMYAYLRIADEKRPSKDITYTCVEQIANAMEDILKANSPQLYGMSVDEAFKSKQDQLKSDVEENSAIIKKAMHKKKLQHFSPAQIDSLPLSVRLSLAPRDFESPRLHLLIQNPAEFFYFLTILPENFHARFFEILTHQYIITLIGTAENFLQGLTYTGAIADKVLANRIHASLLKTVGFEFIDSQFNNTLILKAAARILSPNNFKALVKDYLRDFRLIEGIKYNVEAFISSLPRNTQSKVRSVLRGMNSTTHFHDLTRSSTPNFFFQSAYRGVADLSEPNPRGAKRVRIDPPPAVDENALTQEEETVMSFSPRA